jgi:hypothetical protein
VSVSAPSRTLPGPDDAWNLRWVEAEKGLNDYDGRSWEWAKRPDTPDFADLRQFSDDTDALRADAHQRIGVEISAAGSLLLRAGRLAQAVAATACLSDYHHGYPGPNFGGLRDSAHDVVARWDEAQSSRTDTWMVSSSLYNVLFSGGKQGFPFFWVAQVAHDPDKNDDARIVFDYLDGHTYGSYATNQYDRNALLNVPALRVLGEVMSSYRAQLNRIAVSSSTVLVARRPDILGRWNHCTRAAAATRVILGSGATARRHNSFEIAAIPEHALAHHGDEFVLDTLPESEARSVVDRAAEHVQGDPDILRELDSNGFGLGVARRVAFKLGLPQPVERRPFRFR